MYLEEVRTLISEVVGVWVRHMHLNLDHTPVVCVQDLW